MNWPERFERRLQFPIFDKPSERIAELLQFVPDSPRRAIEAAQPYTRGKTARRHYLWAVNQLDNTDKHREIAFTSRGLEIHLVRNGVKIGHLGEEVGEIEEGGIIPVPAAMDGTDIQALVDPVLGVFPDELRTSGYVQLSPRNEFHDALAYVRQLVDEIEACS